MSTIGYDPKMKKMKRLKFQQVLPTLVGRHVTMPGQAAQVTSLVSVAPVPQHPTPWADNADCVWALLGNKPASVSPPGNRPPEWHLCPMAGWGDSAPGQP